MREGRTRRRASGSLRTASTRRYHLYKQAGKDITVKVYNADHAFVNEVDPLLWNPETFGLTHHLFISH